MADAGSQGNKGTKDGVGMNQIIISGIGFEPVEKWPTKDEVSFMDTGEISNSKVLLKDPAMGMLINYRFIARQGRN